MLFGWTTILIVEVMLTLGVIYGPIALVLLT
jgi:hypothetical protein